MLSDIAETDVQTSRLAVVRRYISDHMDEPLERGILAAVAGFSVPHLHRLWRVHTGVNVATYVRRMRLQRAALKLRMGAVDITEVALSAGYDTHAAFSRAFKQQYRLSPSQFRNPGAYEIWVCLRDGSNAVQLTAVGNAGGAKWSPDGRTIVYREGFGAHTSVYVISAEGGAPRRLTTGPFYDKAATFSQEASRFTSPRNGAGCSRSGGCLPVEGSRFRSRRMEKIEICHRSRPTGTLSTI